MSKSTLFVLACCLFVAVVLGVDNSNINRSPLPTPAPVAVTPIQVCSSRGYNTACAQYIPRVFCANLKCRKADGTFVRTGKAPDDMWCANNKVCRNGDCVPSSRIPAPEPFDLPVC
ncbi:uncharacterized protein [Venturia canescens]|nr:uncharacterized protein LOC122411706 isoform X2 [Venturia canescens]